MESVAIDIGLKDVSVVISCLAFFRLLFQLLVCAFLFCFSVKNKSEVVATEGFQWSVVTAKCLTKCCS